MLIFGNDDNDDDLDLDFDGKQNKAPTPPTSSLPTRPATKNPFGSNTDEVDSLVPEKKTELPARKLPASPFGQTPQQNKPRLPQNPLPDVKRSVPAANENTSAQKPKPPFARPSEEAPKENMAPPVPSLSSYLPPVKRSVPEEVEPEVEEADSEPETLSESEQYLRTMQEQAAQRAEAARLEELAQKAAGPVTNSVEPTVNSTPVAVPAPVAEEEDKKKKKKNGFFSPPPKKDPKKAAAKPIRENKYDGERKKILYIRLIAGSVAAIIAIAGVQAIFLPDSGPTKAQVQSAAKEAVNYTGFPTTSGEQFALDFTKAYFNFDSKDETRLASLERFANPELVKQIDIQILSPAEYEAIKKSDESYSNYKVSQTVSYGPYVVASKNITAENAVFTVKVGLKSGTVVYLDVPVKYDPKNYALTLAGPPSFSKPIQNQGEASKEEWTSAFEGGGDDAIEKEIKSDLEAYLSAWALSDSTIVNRYILDSATDNAKKGLQKSVKFNEIIDLQVEPQSEERPSTATSRRVEINVMWEDPTTGLRYPQQYRMLIAKNQEGKWAIYDIQNFIVLNK